MGDHYIWKTGLSGQAELRDKNWREHIGRLVTTALALEIKIQTQTGDLFSPNLGISILALTSVQGYHGYLLFVWIYGTFLGGFQYVLKMYTFQK